mmetsp:Transcript_1220/g.3393  ORF Transcript_1220/g.3393 Transcript_1220/m.3393 type:complete len:223 (+) Transcript_1220:118-786(+)
MHARLGGGHGERQLGQILVVHHLVPPAGEDGSGSAGIWVKRRVEVALAALASPHPFRLDGALDEILDAAVKLASPRGPVDVVRVHRAGHRRGLMLWAPRLCPLEPRQGGACLERSQAIEIARYRVVQQKDALPNCLHRLMHLLKRVVVVVVVRGWVPRPDGRLVRQRPLELKKLGKVWVVRQCEHVLETSILFAFTLGPLCHHGLDRRHGRQVQRNLTTGEF